MFNQGIKFNQANFEYYLLQITPKTEIEQVKSKIIGFKKLGLNNNTIVLSLNGQFDSDRLMKIVTDIKNFTGSVDINLHSVLHNDSLNVNSIAEVDVIKLPQSKKSNHIYNKTLIIDEPVRSGIKLDNDGDIVINSFVSDNAELIASGNIHVYGEARGRLIAGSGGDKTSRIFVTNFNAELIAIGGVYKIIDVKLPDSVLHKMVMITLDEKERLSIVPL